MTTPFRSTQARIVVAGALRSLAPHISVEQLRQVVTAVALDKALWLELELTAVNARALPEPDTSSKLELRWLAAPKGAP